MDERCLAACFVLVLCAGVVAGRSPPNTRVEALELVTVTREVDLTTPLVKQKVTMVVENKGSKPISILLYTVEPQLASKVSYIGAQVEVNKEEMHVPVVEDSPLPKQSEAATYKITLPPMSPGSSMTVVVEIVLAHTVLPFPTEISQNEKQLVKATLNSYLYSPYPCKTQSMVITLPNSNIESFTRVAPTNSAEQTLTYGPYSDMRPFSYAKVEVHFENNKPFLAVVDLERIIEISHWGNIAVEEHVHVKHIGAALKGSFSRYDFQRNPNSGPSAVKSYTTLLPAAAQDIYYRDEIGNISTSNAREEEDYVSLELRPRFPLFGGWQTRYYYGYNVPSYEYLFHQGSRYLLKMRLVDHVFDDQLIQKATVKIILPEGVKDIQLQRPLYKVEEDAQEIKLTYLDTIGRPVIVCRAENLVEQHIQDFQLTYTFESVMLLQEPLLMVVGLYLFFLFVIVIVRLDFSITKDAALLARQQASVLIDSILKAHDKRVALVSTYRSSISSFKNSSDTKTFKSTKKSLDDQFKAFGERVSQLAKELQPNDPDGAAKIQEVQKKMTEVSKFLEESCFLAEKVVSGSLSKQQYIDQNKMAGSQVDKLLQEISNIVHTL